MRTQTESRWPRGLYWLAAVALAYAVPLADAVAQPAAGKGSSAATAQPRAHLARAFELLQQARAAEALQPLMAGLSALGTEPAYTLAGRLEDAQLMQSAHANHPPPATEQTSAGLAQQLLGQAMAAAPARAVPPGIAGLLETIYAAPPSPDRTRALSTLQGMAPAKLAETLAAELTPPAAPAPTMAAAPAPRPAMDAPPPQQEAQMQAQRQWQAQQEAQRQQCVNACESQYEACAQAKSAQNTTAAIGYLAGIFGGNMTAAAASAQTFTDKSECHAARRSCTAGCTAQLASASPPGAMAPPAQTQPASAGQEDRPSVTTQMTGSLLSAYGAKLGDGRLVALGSALQGKTTDQAMQDYLAAEQRSAAPASSAVVRQTPAPSQSATIPPIAQAPIPPTPRANPPSLPHEPLRLPQQNQPSTSPSNQAPAPSQQRLETKPPEARRPRPTPPQATPTNRNTGDGTLGQESPRTVTVGTSPFNRCPMLFVNSRRPGSTDYNRKYPFTRVTYEGTFTSSETGEVITRRDTEGIYIGNNSEATREATIMIAGLKGMKCGIDSWHITIIQWYDSMYMLQ